MTPHATPSAAPRIRWGQIAGWLGPWDRVALLVCAVLAFAAALMRWGWAQGAVCAVLGGTAAAIVLIDLRHFRIPDRLSLPLIPLGVVFAALSGPVLPRLLAMAAVWSVLTLLQHVFRRLRGKSGLGGGDVKLMTAAALWLDPQTLPVFVLAASVTALIEGLIRRTNRDGRIAFGAHLAPWLLVFVLIA